MHKQTQEYKEKFKFNEQTTLLDAVLTIIKHQDEERKKAEKAHEKLIQPDIPSVQMF